MKIGTITVEVGPGRIEVWVEPVPDRGDRMLLVSRSDIERFDKIQREHIMSQLEEHIELMIGEAQILARRAQLRKDAGG